MYTCFDPERVYDLIYFGSTDAEGWNTCLRELASLCGASSAFSCHDFRGKAESVRLYNGSTTPLHDTEEALVTRLLLDGMHDYREECVSRVDAGADGSWLILRAAHYPDAVFMLSKGPGDGFSDETVAMMQNLAPHLFRSAKLRDGINRMASRARSATALLDLLDTPVFLVDVGFRVVLANNAARTLEQRGVVKLSNDRLRFESRETMDRARNALAGISQQMSGDDNERLIRFDQADGTSLLAVIEPLDALFTDNGAAPDEAAAAIFLKDPHRAVPSTEAALREMHNMPPAEARLATALAEGVTIKAYAADEGLSEGYVRDLSKRVMSRLGVNRQPDLIRAIIRIAPEIGG